MNKHPDPGEFPERAHGVEPEHGADAGRTADELLAHGVLTYLHADSRLAQEDRVLRVMAELEAKVVREPETGREDARRLTGGRRWARGWVRAAAGIAAVFTVVGALLLMGMPGEVTALAQTQRAIEKLRSAGGGDRRYEVRAILEMEGGMSGGRLQEQEAIGVVDMRAPSSMVIRARLPDGRMIVAGRDGAGAWNLRPDGLVDRVDYKRGWPRWAEVDGEPLLADSVDEVLESVTKGYAMERTAGGATGGATGTGGRALDKIVGRRLASAERKAAEAQRQRRERDGEPGGPGGWGGAGGPAGGPGRPGGPSPEEIEIWIDGETATVERIELRWPELPARRPGARGPGPGGGGPGGPGRMAPPPRVLVIERVETPRLDDAWFDPLTHLSTFEP